MNIVENVEISISQQDIEELIKIELERKGYIIDGKISINLKTECTGFGPNEHDTTVFKNITCKAKFINE